MKIKIEDPSALPEGLRGLVADTDDGKVLDLAQLAPTSELEKFKGKALTAQNEAIDRRKELEAWKGLGETPEAVQEALKNAGKGKKDDGEHERIVQQLKDAHAQELASRDETITKMRTTSAQDALKAELSKAGVVPEGLDLLAGFAASRIQFNDDGTPKVLSKDGSGPMIGNGANGGATLGDLAKELAGSIPHLVKDGGKGGSGKQPGSDGGTPDQKTVTRAQWDTMDHSARAEHSKQGGKVVDG